MNNQGLKRILRWGEGKPIFTVLSGRAIVTSNALLVDYLNRLHHETFKWPFEPPAISEWLSFYRYPRQWEEELLIAIAHTEEEGKELAAIWHGAKVLQRMSPKKRQQVLESIRKEDIESANPKLHKTLMGLLDQTKQSIEDEAGSANAQPVQRPKGVESAPYYFLIHVHFPCLAIHHTLPVMLYRKARNGNLAALEKLILIDKSVIFDPKIARFLHHLSLTDRTRYRELFAQKLSRRFPSISSKKFKVAMASFLSLLRGRFHVNAPEIAELFDGMHQATTGNLYDPDIPDKTSTFPKAIQRDRPEWIKGLHLDSIQKPPGQK